MPKSTSKKSSTPKSNTRPKSRSVNLARTSRPSDTWRRHKLPLTILFTAILVATGVYGYYQYKLAHASTYHQTKISYSYRPDGSGYDANYACYDPAAKFVLANIAADAESNSGEVPLVRGQVYGGPGMAYYSFAFYGPKKSLEDMNGGYPRQLNFGPARVVGAGGSPVYVAQNYSWLGGPSGTTFTPGTIPAVDPATNADNYISFGYQIRGTWQLVNMSPPIALKSIPGCDGAPSLDKTGVINDTTTTTPKLAPGKSSDPTSYANTSDAVDPADIAPTTNPSASDQKANSQATAGQGKSSSKCSDAKSCGTQGKTSTTTNTSGSTNPTNSTSTENTGVSCTVFKSCGTK